MNDLVTIIVPVYKCEKYIRKCIESILSQTYQNFELILVDDGSTDTSSEICESYKKKDNRIILIHKQNGGLSSARNVGLDKAKGNWILFVDSDDWINENLCNRCVKYAHETNSDVVVFELIKVFKDNYIKMSVENVQTGILSKNAAMSLLGDDGFGSYAGNKIYRKELFENIRYPEGKYLEDIGTTCYLFDKANVISYLKEPYYYYLQRSDSIMHSMSSKKVRDQFELRLEQNKFFKDKYPDACAFSSEALFRSAIIYCLYFCEEMNENKPGLLKYANEVVCQRGLDFKITKLKVLVLYIFYRKCPWIFKLISRMYLKFNDIELS